MADSKKSLYIPDASTLLKWIVKETEDQEQALLFQHDIQQGNIEIMIPEYCFAEIANFLGRKFNRIKAQSCLSLFLLAGFNTISLSIGVASRAFLLMNKFRGISFYDAYYHACALLKDAVYLTADKKYYAKTCKQGNIILLKNYEEN